MTAARIDKLDLCTSMRCMRQHTAVLLNMKKDET